MLQAIQFDPREETPIYRQLHTRIKSAILNGEIGRGEKLPATRELAGLLGLNRATVSAAYELLESGKLISGQVGRGSYVTAEITQAHPGVDWGSLLDRSETSPSANTIGLARDVISFGMSRPSSDLF